MSSARFMIAASGSGGHLFPAVFIAQALQELDSNCEILFVGSGRPLEAQIIDARGFKRVVISFVGIKNRGLKGLLQALSMFPRAFFQSWRHHRAFRPSVVVGVGGYASVLPVLIGKLRGVPSWIHEAELEPGTANKFLGRFVNVCSTVFPGVKIPGCRDIRFTGHPLRPELASVPQLANDLARPQHLLILGGSQGSTSIDRAFLSLASTLKSLGLKIWHQCRSENQQLLEKGYAMAGVEARVQPFIENMTEAYSWAEAVVGRSGAASVLELDYVRRPAILVPYLHAQGNHQLTNALTLVDAGKALLVQEQRAEEGDPERRLLAKRLEEALFQICDPAKFQQLKESLSHSRKMDGAHEIAKQLLELASSSQG